MEIWSFWISAAITDPRPTMWHSESSLIDIKVMVSQFSQIFSHSVFHRESCFIFWLSFSVLVRWGCGTMCLLRGNVIRTTLVVQGVRCDLGGLQMMSWRSLSLLLALWLSNSITPNQPVNYLFNHLIRTYCVPITHLALWIIRHGACPQIAHLSVGDSEAPAMIQLATP